MSCSLLPEAPSGQISLHLAHQVRLNLSMTKTLRYRRTRCHHLPAIAGTTPHWLVNSERNANFYGTRVGAYSTLIPQGGATNAAIKNIIILIINVYLDSLMIVLPSLVKYLAVCYQVDFSHSM